VTARGAQASGNTGLTSARVRQRMVDRIRELGIRDERVLAALLAVPRHLFVDAALASRAYDDCALPLGYGQTISQPYIVARSAELALGAMADPKLARVLEVGTGSGYAAAVFAQIFGRVFSIERVRTLHERARANLRPLRLANVRLAFGDGIEGLPNEAPFDVIIASAAAGQTPLAWGEQLASGGVVVAPMGSQNQQLSVLSKDRLGRWVCRHIEPVRFVPLVSGVIPA